MVTAQPRTSKGADTKQRILDAAAELLEETGYRDVSLRAIAKHLSLNPTSLLRYFPTREAIFTALLSQRDDQDQGLPPARSGLAGLLLAAVQRNESRRAEVLLYLTLAADATDPLHPAHDFFAAHFSLAIGDVRRDLETLRPDLDVLSQERLARIVVAIADGLQLQWAHGITSTMAEDFEAAVGIVRATIESAVVDDGTSPTEPATCSG